MPSVKLLTDSLISKISAGEVVESPLSLVKELVENALDAKADNIRIDLKKSGKEFISVTDNGFGMSSDDLVMAVRRHATSKISTVQDLSNINTLGFRGEALAAISAVSNLEIFSSADDSGLGSFIEVAGGKVIKQGPTEFPKGTRVIVKDLFFNLPARLKFLKSDRSEAIKIFGLLDKIMLLHKDIRFQITHGKRNSIYPSTDSFLSRIAKIMDESLATNMIEVSRQSGDIKVFGYVGRPEVAKERRYRQWVYVNGRPVSSFLINRAVYRGFDTLLMKNMHPLFFIMLQVSPELVDVNVHPSKNEVKFFNDALVSTVVKEAVRFALFTSAKGSMLDNKDAVILADQNLAVEGNSFLDESSGHQHLAKKMDLTNVANYPGALASQTSHRSYDLNHLAKTETAKNQNWQKSFNNNLSVSDHGTNSSLQNDLALRIPGIDDKKAASGMSVLAQFQKYIIVQKHEDLLIFDAHATHERILYENIKNDFAAKKVVSSRLLAPEVIKLSAYEVFTLESNQELWSNIGFEFRHLGDNDFSVNALPSFLKDKILNNTSLKDVINNVLAELADFGSIDNIDNYYHKAFASFACHLAIRGQEKLSIEEMNNLINRVIKLDIDLYCPHGRPIFQVFRGVDIDKMFKRVL